MEHKGFFWSILFMFILFFVLTNTITLPSVFLTPKVVVFHGDFLQSSFVTVPYEVLLHPPAEEELFYQQFHLTIEEFVQPNSFYDDSSNASYSATFYVARSFLDSAGVLPDHISLLRRDSRSSEWIRLNVSVAPSSSYYVLELDNATSGDYAIVCLPTETPQTFLSFSMQLGLLILVVLFFLFAMYHHHLHWDTIRHERRHAPGDADLERFIRQALLAHHTEKEIKDRLLKAGWSEDRIIAAFNRVRYL